MCLIIIYIERQVDLLEQLDISRIHVQIMQKLLTVIQFMPMMQNHNIATLHLSN
jgi:hypothetical protein